MIQQEKCPCIRKCIRHNHCITCQEYHRKKMKYVPACQKKRKRKSAE